jgi:hypothetical protein
MASPSRHPPQSGAWQETLKLLEQGATQAAAASFARAAGLHYDPPDEVPATAGGNGSAAGLAGALRRSRTKQVGWWRRVAEGWLELGIEQLAVASAARGRQMVSDGIPASWDDLKALVELLLRAEPVPAGASERPGPSTTRPRMQPERHSEKRRRLGLLFGLGDDEAVNARIHRLHEDGDLAGLLCMKTSRVYQEVRLVRLWNQAGEHQAAVEEFLSEVVGRSMSEWLPNVQDELVTCGRSFLQLGDHITAYACFRLALALEHDGEDPDIQPQPPDPKEGPPTLTEADVARDYCVQLRAARPLLESPEGVRRTFSRGFRAGEWLTDQGLEGCLIDYARTQRADGLRDRTERLAHQLRSIGERSGWFLPLVEMPEVFGGALEAVVPAPPPMAVLPLDRSRGGRATPQWRLPQTLTPPPEPSPGRRALVPVGLVESGGPAALEIKRGAPLLALGPPASDSLLLSLANRVQAQGWTVLWLRQLAQESPAAEAGRAGSWHTIRTTGSLTGLSAQWLQELAGSELLRTAIQHCLEELLPPCSDPSAGACIQELLESVGTDEVVEAIGGDETGVRRHAVDVVARAGGLTFQQPRDLRRAVVLLEHVNGALSALRHAVRVDWTAPPRAAEATGAGRVLVDLPAGKRLDAALLAILCVGSLLQAARNPPRMPATRTEETWVDAYGDFTLEPEPHPSSGDPEEIQELRRTAGAAPVSERTRTSPWIQRRVLPTATDPMVCVLLSGSFGAELLPLLRWFRRGQIGGRHALVAGVQGPSPTDLAVAGLYEAFLVGHLSPDQCELFQIASGVQIAKDHTDDLGPHGAVYLEELSAPGVRVMVMPDVEA